MESFLFQCGYSVITSMLLALPNIDVTHVTFDGRNALFHGSVDSTAPNSTHNKGGEDQQKIEI